MLMTLFIVLLPLGVLVLILMMTVTVSFRRSSISLFAIVVALIILFQFIGTVVVTGQESVVVIEDSAPSVT